MKRRAKRAQRQIRKNADDALRKAERAWLADKENDELRVRYWREALRADKLPLPTTQIGFDRWWQHYIAPGFKHRSQVTCLIDSVPPPYTRYTVYTRDLDGFLIDQREFMADRLSEAENAVKTSLRFLLELKQSNPPTGRAKRTKRRNSDDKLRQLERKMLSSEEPQDVWVYWKACLKSRTLPIVQEWLSGPKDSQGYALTLGKYIWTKFRFPEDKGYINFRLPLNPKMRDRIDLEQQEIRDTINCSVGNYNGRLSTNCTRLRNGSAVDGFHRINVTGSEIIELLLEQLQKIVELYENTW